MPLSWTQRILRTILASFVAVAVAGGALAWRLQRAPIPLAFLDRRIEAALSGITPTITAHVEHTELGWAAHLPELRVLGVTLTRSDGETVVSLPRLGILPSLRALARGQFAVHRVSVHGVHLMLVRAPDGQVSLGLRSGGPGGSQEAIDLSAIVASGGADDSTARFLKRFRFDDADVILDDRATGSRWHADDADGEIVQRAGGLDARLSGTFSMASGSSAIAREIVLPIAAKARMTRGSDGGLSEVSFQTTVKGGRIVPAGEAGPALPIRALAVEGAFGGSSRRVDIRTLHLTIGSAVIDAGANVSVDDLGQGLELHGEIRTLPITDLHRLWPPGAAPSVREWIDKNIHDGAVSRGRFVIRMPPSASQPVPAEAVDVRFDFEGLTVHYFGDLEPVTRVRGSGLLTAERFAGRVAQGQIGDLRVTDGRVDIPFRPARLKVAANVAGPSKRVLAVIDEAPLAFMQRIGLRTGDITGTSENHVEVELPLKPEVTSGDVRVTATGRLHEASLVDVVGGVGLDKGELTVKVDGKHVTVDGESGLTGLPATVAPVRLAVTFDPGSESAADRLHVSLDGTDLLAKGEALLDDKTLTRLTIERLRFRGSDLSGVIVGRDGGYQVSLDGESLDLEPLWRGEHSAEQIAKMKAPYDAQFRFSHVSMMSGLELVETHGRAHGEGGRIRSLQADGAVGKGGPFRIDLGKRRGAERLEVSADQAGHLIKLLGVFEDAEGGHLSLDAKVDDQGQKTRLDGVLEIDDFRVTKAPILARVLSLGSLQGIADLLGGEGIAVTRARIPFTWSAGVVGLKEARAIGAVGLTADGTIDRASGRIALRGNVIPAYTLNTALGKVPFVGRFLVGTKGEGVFGVAYSVSGSLDNPRVDVNALSALAPGMLREMFVDPFQRDRDHAPAAKP